MEKQDISIMVGEHLLNFRVSAVIKKGDKILVHHTIGSEHFTLPGGRVKEGESSIEAIKREIKEELNIETEYIRAVSIIENFFEMKGKQYHEILMTHELKFKEEEIYNKESYEPAEIDKKDKLEFFWIKVKDIEQMNFVPNAMKEILKNESNEFVHIINDDRINEKLKKYIEKEVFPQYKLNGESHGIEHIKRSNRKSNEDSSKL